MRILINIGRKEALQLLTSLDILYVFTGVTVFKHATLVAKLFQRKTDWIRSDFHILLYVSVNSIINHSYSYKSKKKHLDGSQPLSSLPLTKSLIHRIHIKWAHRSIYDCYSNDRKASLHCASVRRHYGLTGTRPVVAVLPDLLHCESTLCVGLQSSFHLTSSSCWGPGAAPSGTALPEPAGIRGVVS